MGDYYQSEWIDRPAEERAKRHAAKVAAARAEGFRAGAEAMKNATLEDIAYRIEYGAKKYGRRDISVEIMRAIEEMVRSLPIPESDHG